MVKIRRVGTMKTEEVVTRTLFGTILIAAFFIPGGRWIGLILGIVFLLSAASGFPI